MTPRVNAAKPIPTPTRVPARLVEVDAAMRPAQDGLFLATGTIKLDHGFMTRLLPHLLRNPRRFRNITMTYDARAKAYTASGAVCLKGVWLDFKTQARPVISGNQLGFQFINPHLGLLSGGWVGRGAARIVADALSRELGASADGATVRLDTNRILDDIGGVPGFVRLQTGDTRFGVALGDQGDVTVSMAAQGTGAAANRTSASDFAVTADSPGLAALLSRVCGDSFEVNDVSWRKGGLVLHGTTEYAPVSKLVTGVRTLAAVLISQGRVSEVNPSVVRGPLDLDVQLDGTRVSLKPSLAKALDPIRQALTDAGLQPREADGRLRFDLGPWLATKGITVQDLAATPAGLAGHIAFDLDSRIKNPALRGG